MSIDSAMLMHDALRTMPKYWRVRVIERTRARAKRCEGFQVLLKAEQRDAARHWLHAEVLKVIEEFRETKWGGRVPRETPERMAT